MREFFEGMTKSIKFDLVGIVAIQLFWLALWVLATLFAYLAKLPFDWELTCLTGVAVVSTPIIWIIIRHGWPR